MMRMTTYELSLQTEGALVVMLNVGHLALAKSLRVGREKSDSGADLVWPISGRSGLRIRSILEQHDLLVPGC